MDKLPAHNGGPGGPHDEAWFNGLFDSYYVAVRNFAYQLLGDMDAAQETAQDVFVRLWEKGSRAEAERTLRAFLFTAARNLSFDRIRSDKVLSEYRRKIMLKYPTEEESFLDELITSDLERKFEQQIESLPRQCGRAFRLSRIDGMTYKEIAREMGISVKAVEANVSRAIALLRTKMGGLMLLAAILLAIRGE